MYNTQKVITMQHKYAKGAFQQITERVKPENKVFVDLSLDIAAEIRLIMRHHLTIKTKRDLAIALNKEEDEIGKWLSGLYNFTIENIAEISIALHTEIILVSSRTNI